MQLVLPAVDDVSTIHLLTSDTAADCSMMCFGRCRMQADRLSAGQHPAHHHHPQHQSVEQSANRSVTTIMFPPVSEQVQSSAAASASSATTAAATSRDRSSSSAFLLTASVLCYACMSCIYLVIVSIMQAPSLSWLDFTRLAFR